MKRSIAAIIIGFLFSFQIVHTQDTPQSPLLQSFDEYLVKKAETRFHFDWVQTGPVFNSARAEAVQGVPSQPGSFYVAFGSGNLWKTIDHGLTWKPIFENQAAQGIGDFVVSPSDPEVIYVGTGESLKKARNFTLPGTGVYRSSDGGNTWKHLGLSDSYHIGEIIVHPDNPDVVFVAVMGHFWTSNKNRGVYRSTNGGENWEHVLYINDSTGANDIVISPSDPSVLYASMWENYPDISGGNSFVYSSKDGGATWQKAGAGLPEGKGTGRIGLAVSWQNPDKVYALVDNRAKDGSTTAEVYRTIDGAQSWRRTHEDELQFMARLWYFADMYVNPLDDEEIWGLGVRIAHSVDGGQTFDMIGGEIHHHTPSEAVPLHLDHCEFWVNPLNPKHQMLGNDGGLYMTYDGGAHWRHYNNIPAGEFYDIAVDQQDPYMIYGGTQDNSTVFGPSREWNPIYPDGWEYVWLDAWSGGDGCMTYPDPDNPEVIYTSSQNGGIFKKDMLKDQTQSIRPRLPKKVKGKLNYNFVAPYILSHHDSGVLYHAGNYVFKSDNKGDDWKLISPDLSVCTDEKRSSLAAGAIAESPLDKNMLFVGTDHGLFWVTTDQGETWVDRSGGLPVAYVRNIVPSLVEKNRVYVTLTGINYDDLSAHMYKSEDLGKTWVDLGDDLPDEVVNCMLEYPDNPEVLFLGTLRGIYVSEDRGQNWHLFGDEVAPTCVADLVYQPEANDLVIGTHGRGIYKVNLDAFDDYLANKPDELTMLPIQDGFSPYRNATHRDVNFESIKKTTFAFWSPETQTVKLKVRKNMKDVFVQELEAKAGLNVFRWDLVVSEQDNGSAYFIHFKRFLSPGKYDVQLDNGSEKSTVEWLVKPTTYPFN